ncbi:YeeE/YedE family protein [Methylomonas sp. SURF-2]|uniref:YeeE/YedE family protein n=1 Tax=Methylomonas subterranea TaxID=2952225 RepID=A0ABT1TKC4_9GAMM|nr:YeeE/YedE family protein [Methylomonas sp. SURF-2]MCQ8105184.1 YeeE/YedE family protein [Methylomonas sp. SURF-2]
MTKTISALLAGTVFGLGLAVSQMLDPNKVLAFLDIAGAWDPSLALVMAGALAVAASGFRWTLTHEKPVLGSRFHLSRKTALDKPLLAGAALFGVGWGMTGYCPGPAFASLALGNREAVPMLIGIYAGFLAAGLLQDKN